MTVTKRSRLGLIAGILFSLAACLSWYLLIRTILSHPVASNMGRLLQNYFKPVCYTLLAITFFTGRRNFVLLGGVGATFLWSIPTLAKDIHFWRGANMTVFVRTYLPKLLLVICILLLAVMALAVALKKDRLIKKTWYLPGIVAAVMFALEPGRNLIQALVSGTPLFKYLLVAHGSALTFWGGACVCGAMFLAGRWLAYPEVIRKIAVASGRAACHSAGYYPLTKHILLLLFTCGIWNMIWIYRTTDFLNCVQEEEPQNPANKLLLCLFVPFYAIFWTYKNAQRIEKLAKEKGVPCELATVCLVLAIFVPFIAPILMQDKINSLAAGK